MASGFARQDWRLCPIPTARRRVAKWRELEVPDARFPLGTSGMPRKVKDPKPSGMQPSPAVNRARELGLVGTVWPHSKRSHAGVISAAAHQTPSRVTCIHVQLMRSNHACYRTQYVDRVATSILTRANRSFRPLLPRRVVCRHWRVAGAQGGQTRPVVADSDCRPVHAQILLQDGRERDFHQ